MLEIKIIIGFPEEIKIIIKNIFLYFTRFPAKDCQALRPILKSESIKETDKKTHFEHPKGPRQIKFR